jgi:quercetin dioxygenase-like cupin family protein
MDDNAPDPPRACPAQMTIRRAGTAIARAPQNISNLPFWVEPLLESAQEGELNAMRATLDPGVVTHWHSHPRGQALYVLFGVGRVQREGGPVEEVRADDFVWFAPGERHWHGASPHSAFAYVSLQAVENGAMVAWFEPLVLEGEPS